MTKMPDSYACVVVQITHITGTNVFLGIVNHTCETATAFCPCSMVGTLVSSSFLRCPQSCWWLFRNSSSWCSKTTAKALHIFLSHLRRCSSSAFCGRFQENGACSVRWLHSVSTSVPENKAKVNWDKVPENKAKETGTKCLKTRPRKLGQSAWKQGQGNWDKVPKNKAKEIGTKCLKTRPRKLGQSAWKQGQGNWDKVPKNKAKEIGTKCLKTRPRKLGQLSHCILAMQNSDRRN